MTLFDKIKQLCEEKHLSISGVERQADIGAGTIAGWRESSPTIRTLGAVARVLGVTVNDLLEAID